MWWEPILGVVLKVVGTLLAAGITWLVGKLISKINATETEKEALNCLADGVTQTYYDFVKLAKSAASDGKLTEAEKTEARNLAIQKAKELATGKAKDLLVQAGTERLNTWIERLLAAKK